MTLISASSSQKRLALIALLLGGAAIGGSPIFVRLSELGPMATAFWRVALALAPLFVIAQSTGPASATMVPLTRRDYALLIVPGVFLAADLIAWHLSLHLTSVANATLLTNTAPIFVTLGSWLLFRARVSRLFLAGLVIAIVGIIVLKGGPAAIGNGRLLGDATAMIAAVFYAGYILALGRLRSRFSTVTVMLWTTFSAAVCVLPVALIFETDIMSWTLSGWLILAGLAFVSHLSGQGLIIYALAFLPPAFSSLTLLLQPVVAALLAWAILAEPVGILQAIGGLIVLAGILLARKGS
jgi:drug/metabolite transporter (DMT)-like permease